MKPLFISCAILISLFTLGIINYAAISELSDNISEELTLSETAAKAENWDEASAALMRANKVWNAYDTYLHIMINHNDLDETEVLFSSLLQHTLQHESLHYYPEMAQLRTHLEQLKATQQLSIHNIL